MFSWNNFKAFLRQKELMVNTEHTGHDGLIFEIHKPKLACY